MNFIMANGDSLNTIWVYLLWKQVKKSQRENENVREREWKKQQPV